MNLVVPDLIKEQAWDICIKSVTQVSNPVFIQLKEQLRFQSMGQVMLDQIESNKYQVNNSNYTIRRVEI